MGLFEIVSGVFYFVEFDLDDVEICISIAEVENMEIVNDVVVSDGNLNRFFGEIIVDEIIIEVDELVLDDMEI